MHRFARNFNVTAYSICMSLAAIAAPALAQDVEIAPDISARVDWTYKSEHPPAYPDSVADALCSTDATILRVDVDERGDVLAVKVEYTDGNAALDEAALQAARGWRYYPALSHGKPHADSIRVPVEFKAADVCWQTLPDTTAHPEPESMRRAPPSWPVAAKTGPGGVVVLKIKVDDTRKLPYAVDVDRSSGDDAIDNAAALAATLWTFQPARLKGVPVRSVLRWTVPYGTSR
jgi:protein TonB